MQHRRATLSTHPHRSARRAKIAAHWLRPIAPKPEASNHGQRASRSCQSEMVRRRPCPKWHPASLAQPAARHADHDHRRRQAVRGPHQNQSPQPPQSKRLRKHPVLQCALSWWRDSPQPWKRRAHSPTLFRRAPHRPRRSYHQWRDQLASASHSFKVSLP